MERVLWSLLVLMLAASLVFADGGCPERPASAQEFAAFQSVFKAAQAARPPAPADWVVKDTTDPMTGSTVPKCPEGPGDVALYYVIRFRYQYSSEAADREDRAAVDRALKGTPEQQARIAELDKRIAELEEAKKEARRNRDQAEKNRVRDELRAAEKEKSRISGEITDAYVQRAMSGRVAAEMNRNKPERTEAELAIKVNERHAWVPAACTAAAVPGASQAYWCGEGKNGGRMVILIGAWDTKAKKGDLARTPLVTRAQNMLIEISAEKAMAEGLARQLRLDLLKKELEQ